MPNQQHAMRELEPHSMSIHQIIQQGASGLQSMSVIGTVYVCMWELQCPWNHVTLIWWHNSTVRLWMCRAQHPFRPKQQGSHGQQ